MTIGFCLYYFIFPSDRSIAVNQHLAPAAVLDHGGIAWDELFAHAQLGAERALGDDHTPVLPLDEYIPQIAEEIENLAHDGRLYGMVGAQVEFGVFTVDGGKTKEQVKGIPQPVMPDVGEAELDLRVLVGGGHIVWLERYLPLLDLIIEPHADHVVTSRKFIHLITWALNNRLSTAPDGVVVHEGQMDYVQLVLDGARVMRIP